MAVLPSFEQAVADSLISTGWSCDGVDGSANSGHIAQVVDLDFSGERLVLVNTHLKWDPPNTPPERQFGLRQARLALEALRQEAIPQQSK